MAREKKDGGATVGHEAQLRQTAQAPRQVALRDPAMIEACLICGCRLHRGGDYAKPTVEGRSHATRHHYVAERFFGRSENRPGDQRERILKVDPWGMEGQTGVFCYECHEELLHNPVLLPSDLELFRELVRRFDLAETEKPPDCEKLAGRIKLLHEVLRRGLETMQAPETGGAR